MSPTKHPESLSIQVLIELSVWARFAPLHEGGAPRILRRSQTSARVTLIFPNVKQDKMVASQVQLFPNVKRIRVSERSLSFPV